MRAGADRAGDSLASVREGDVVLDVGSNVGVFTRAALRAGARLVVAFEPNPGTIECFKRTFSAELQEGAVVLVEAAASDQPGKVKLAFAEPNSPITRISETGTVEVEATTIDQVVEELGLDTVDFVKMDIEGAERYALAGARSTIAKFGPRMALCVYHREDDREVIPRIVVDARPTYKIALTDSQAYFGR